MWGGGHGMGLRQTNTWQAPNHTHQWALRVPVTQWTRTHTPVNRMCKRSPHNHCYNAANPSHGVWVLSLKANTLNEPPPLAFVGWCAELVFPSALNAVLLAGYAFNYMQHHAAACANPHNSQAHLVLGLSLFNCSNTTKLQIVCMSPVCLSKSNSP